MLLPPLTSGRLIRRYKRFLADVALDDGREVTVHCPNPGAMTGLAEPGTGIWLSTSDRPGRKYAMTWVLSTVGDSLAGIDTGLPNALVHEALLSGRIPELSGYAEIRREVRYGQESRIDFRLSGGDQPDCWVEVKSVTLERSGTIPGLAEFPDTVTTRGARHMRVLEEIVGRGDRAVILYVVQRPDCGSFALAGDIDPAYARNFAQGLMSGVQGLCYDCAVQIDRIEVRRRLPVTWAQGETGVLPE